MRKLIWSASFLALCGLSGCDGDRNDALEVSALPLIQQEITTLVPVFDGKRNKTIMDQVCTYVNGQKSIGEFKTFFTQKGVNIDELAAKDAGFRFLSGADKPALTTACAAFIASTFFTEQNLLGEDSTKLSEDELRKKMRNFTPFALETVNLLAELAAQHQNEKFESPQAYKDKIHEAFNKKAPQFIERTLNHKFTLTDYDSNGVENGFSYTFFNGIISIYLYSEQWLGNGKIMGKRYSVYLPQSMPEKSSVATAQ